MDESSILVGPGRGPRHARQRTVIFRLSIPTRGAELAPGLAPTAVASGGRPGLALRVLPVPADVAPAAARAMRGRGLRHVTTLGTRAWARSNNNYQPPGGISLYYASGRGTYFCLSENFADTDKA